MATIHVVNNIFSGATAGQYYIDPTKMVYSNLASWDGHGDWVERDGVTVYTDTTSYYYAHTFGFEAGPGWSPDQSVKPLGFDTLSLTFRNAAFRRSEGVYKDLTVEIIGAWLYNNTSSTYYCPMVALANDSDSGETGFWIQSYMTGGESKCAGTATVRMTIVGDAGATFAFPFTDIDIRYDGEIDDTVTGSKYAESVTLNPEGFSGTCTDIYVSSGSWLNLRRGSGSPTPVKNLNGQSFSEPLRLDNGDAREDDTEYGEPTGLIGIFKSGAQVIWTGSRCGTSLRGGRKSAVRRIDYYGNPYSWGSVTPPSIIDYKWANTALNITSTIPVHTLPQGTTSNNARVVFLGWATSSSGTPEYSAPGSALTNKHQIAANDNTTSELYARWRLDYLVTFIANSSRGSGQPNNIGYIVTDSAIAHTASAWYAASTRPVFPSAWRVKQLGYNATGWSSTNDGTKDYDISAQLATLTGPTNYYATFNIKTYTVTFHDGFTPGNDIIKKVTVAYDNDVPQADIPVSGQTYTYYDGTVHKFKKPGFYTFAGWSGSLTRIKDNIDVYAMWEFIPIWVMTNGQWVKYDPVEI